MEQKKDLKNRIEDKYGKMIDYYATVLERCHAAVKRNGGLSQLDPMGQKTSATTLFIRTCSRMDESDKQKKLTTDKLNDMANNYVANVSNSVSKQA